MYVVVCDHDWVFVTADNGRKVEVCTECDEERIDHEEPEGDPALEGFDDWLEETSLAFAKGK